MFGHCPYPVEDICPDELRDQQKAQYLPAEGRQEDQAVEKQRPQHIANAQPQAEVVTEASGIVEIGEGRPDAAVPRDAMEVEAGHAADKQPRSEEHTSELQSLMRISYAGI